MDSLEKDIANSIVHMSRHSIVKTPFLKLNSSSAKVLHINPKIMKRLEVEKSRQLVRGKVVPRQAYLIDSAFDDDYNPWVRAVTPSSFQTRPVSPLKMATEKCRLFNYHLSVKIILYFKTTVALRPLCSFIKCSRSRNS